MHVALWFVQILLAVVFLGAGGLKLFGSQETLRAKLGDLADPTRVPALRALGAAEVAAAIGLVAPQATGIAPILVVAAAAGIVIVGIGAAAYHRKRQEWALVAFTLALALAAGFVIWGRLSQ